MTDITEPATPSTEEIEQGLQRGRAQGLRRDRVRGVLYPIGSLIAVLAVWEAATWLLRIPLFLLPPPSVIAEATYRNAGLLASESVVTIIEIAFGFGLSVVVGIPLALAIFLWPPFARTLYPLLISSQAVPKVAVAPLFIVWFGLGLLPKVLIAFLIAFFPVVINTAMGLAAIEPEKIYLARSMGLDPLATFFKIRLPNALPSIFAGLKISITLAVVGAVVGEFVGGQGGLGYLLLIANGSLDTALLFAGLVALTVLGVVFFALVVLLERLVLPAHAIDSAAAARQTM